MTSQLPKAGPPAGASGDSHPPDHDHDHDGLMVPAGLRLAGCLIAVMLVAAAALDLARCGIVMATARHVGPDIGLVSAGLAAAALSLWTARGCRCGRRWSAWAALLIGTASAPQAAMSGFRALYAIPDTATAVLGVLLAVAVLTTAGWAGHPGEGSGNPCTIGERFTR